MANKKNIVPHQFKKGQTGNSVGRIRGSKNRSTVIKEILDFLTEESNPLTMKSEKMSQEQMLYFALLKKAKKGDVSAAKVILDSAYGTAIQSIEIKEKERPIFKQLDISVNRNDSTEENNSTK